MNEKDTARRRNFKKSIDQDDARRRREETTIQIRKTKKEERLNQRRRTTPGQAEAVPGIVPSIPGHTGQGFGQLGPTDGVYNQQKLENLPQMIQGVNSPDASTQLEATTQFRKLLSIERNPPIQAVIDAGVVPKFIEFLKQEGNPALQFEAAWALTNIASGTSDHTNVVIEKGAVPIFVALLSSTNEDVREQAVWALGNIAGDSPRCRDLVLQAGAMIPLLQQLTEQSKLSMLRNATWTLSNFCRGKPQPAFEAVKPALATLARLIFSVDEEVLTDACWALSYLSDGPNEKIQAVIEAGVCNRLVEILMHPSYSVQTPSLRTVGNIVTGDDLQTQVIINFGALPHLLSLLNSPKKGIRKEACWTISNITAGNKGQIQAVIDSNIIPRLIELLRHAEFDIRKEAAWAISNATSGGSPEQIRYLVEQGCIAPLCELLDVADAKIVTVALEGIENILKVGQLDGNYGTNDMATFVAEADGVTKIEELQQHENNEIYERSVKILETYFGAEEEEDIAVAPMTSSNNTFSFGAANMGEQGGISFEQGGLQAPPPGSFQPPPPGSSGPFSFNPNPDGNMS